MGVFNNIFGEIPENHVTFVLDASGSVSDTFANTKEHIIEILIDRAYNRPGTSFNLIYYNSEVKIVNFSYF